MDRSSLRNFFLWERRPILQWWFFSVRGEYLDVVRNACRGRLLEGARKFVGKFSESFLANEGGVAPILVKRLRAQKEVDYARRYFRCQGKREFFGSARLAEIGINCPEPIGYAFNLIPWSRMDSIFISRFISGAGTATEWLQVGAPTRDGLMSAVAKDLRRMLEHNLFHRDLHTNNLLVERAGGADGADAAVGASGLRLYWIDNDIRQFDAKDRARKRELLLQRWLKVLGLLTPEERARFEAELGMGEKVSEMR